MDVKHTQKERKCFSWEESSLKPKNKTSSREAFCRRAEGSLSRMLFSWPWFPSPHRHSSPQIHWTLPSQYAVVKAAVQYLVFWRAPESSPLISVKARQKDQMSIFLNNIIRSTISIECYLPRACISWALGIKEQVQSPRSLTTERLKPRGKDEVNQIVTQT